MFGGIEGVSQAYRVKIERESCMFLSVYAEKSFRMSLVSVSGV